MIKIYMGIPTVFTNIDSQAYLLRDIAKIYKDEVELVYPDKCIRRSFHDFARNAIVEDFLLSECDILWFLDSDVTPTKNVLDLITLHKDKWLVAGATYPVFMTAPGLDNPSVVFTVYKKNTETGNLSLADAPKQGVGWVDGLATGCLFIKRELFSQLNKPYFEFKFHSETRNMEEGEDLGFCRKLSSLGIQFFTDFEMVCKHQKSVDLLDVNNYAIEYANAQVLRYDASIREQIESAIASAHDAGVKKGIKLTLDKIHKDTLPSKIIVQDKTIWTPK